MYSSGLPVLYLVAAVFYLILYWVYKCLLLKYYQRTNRFNEQLAIYSIGYIKYGLLFHMLIGAFMYTNSRILSSSLDIKEIKQFEKFVKNFTSKYMEDRLSSTHAQLYVVILALIVILYLFKNIIIDMLGKYIVKLLCCRVCRKKRASIEGQAAHVVLSNDILKDIELTQFKQLYNRAVTELNDYKELVNTSSYDKSKFDEPTKFTFLNYMKARIERMEQVIDFHMINLLIAS